MLIAKAPRFLFPQVVIPSRFIVEISGGDYEAVCRSDHEGRFAFARGSAYDGVLMPSRTNLRPSAAGKSSIHRVGKQCQHTVSQGCVQGAMVLVLLGCAQAQRAGPLVALSCRVCLNCLFEERVSCSAGRHTGSSVASILGPFCQPVLQRHNLFPTSWHFARPRQSPN